MTLRSDNSITGSDTSSQVVKSMFRQDLNMDQCTNICPSEMPHAFLVHLDFFGTSLRRKTSDLARSQRVAGRHGDRISAVEVHA